MNSILQQDYERFEVIALDGGSIDKTTTILENLAKVRIIHSKINILGYMRQLGVENSAGDIIAFKDSDIIIPDKSWISRMTSLLLDCMALDNRVVAIFTLWKYSREEKCVRRYTTLYCNFILRRNGVLRHGDLLKTSFWGTGETLIVKKAIEDVGGFNRSIHYYEDLDLSGRMVAKGYTFIISTRKLDAVLHIYADSFTVYLRKFYIMSKLGVIQFGGKQNLLKDILSIPWSVLCMTREISRDRDPCWIFHPVLRVARVFLRSLVFIKYTFTRP